jgi:Divergent InlB B-repeat domain
MAVLFESRLRARCVRRGHRHDNPASCATEIDSAPACSATYLAGQSVTLVATPITGSTFTGWIRGGVFRDPDRHAHHGLG